MSPNQSFLFGGSFLFRGYVLADIQHNSSPAYHIDRRGLPRDRQPFQCCCMLLSRVLDKLQPSCSLASPAFFSVSSLFFSVFSLFLLVFIFTAFFFFPALFPLPRHKHYICRTILLKLPRYRAGQILPITGVRWI